MRGSILSPKTEEELKAVLRQFNSDPLWWKEEGNCCSLVKWTRDKRVRDWLSFRFDCELVACGTQTRLDYRVRPGLAAIVLFAVLPLALAAGLLRLLRPDGGSPVFCLAAVIATLLFFLSYFFTGRSYVRELEDLVQ